MKVVDPKAFSGGHVVLAPAAYDNSQQSPSEERSGKLFTLRIGSLNACDSFALSFVVYRSKESKHTDGFLHTFQLNTLFFMKPNSYD